MNRSGNHLLQVQDRGCWGDWVAVAGQWVPIRLEGAGSEGLGGQPDASDAAGCTPRYPTCLGKCRCWRWLGSIPSCRMGRTWTTHSV